MEPSKHRTLHQTVVEEDPPTDEEIVAIFETRRVIAEWISESPLCRACSTPVNVDDAHLQMVTVSEDGLCRGSRRVFCEVECVIDWLTR